MNVPVLFSYQTPSGQSCLMSAVDWSTANKIFFRVILVDHISSSRWKVTYSWHQQNSSEHITYFPPYPRKLEDFRISTQRFETQLFYPTPMMSVVKMLVKQFGFSDGDQLYSNLSNSVLCREPFIYHSVSVHIGVCVCVYAFMYVCMHRQVFVIWNICT